MTDVKAQKTIPQDDEEYTIENLKDEIEAICCDERASLYLYFLLKKDEKTELTRVKFEDKEGGKESEEENTGEGILEVRSLKKMYMDYLNDTLLQNGDAALGSLSSCDGNSDTVYMCEEEDLPEALRPYLDFNVEKQFDSDESSNSSRFFDAKIDTLDELYGYVVYIGTMDQGMTLFTKHYPVALIKRDACLIHIFKKDKFVRVKEGDMLRLSGKAHLLKINDHVIVLDLDTLERGMGYKKIVTQKAQQIIEDMKHWPFFANSSDLDEISKDFRLARKLIRAKKCSPVLTSKVPWDRFVKYIRNTPALKDMLKLDDGLSDKESKIHLSTSKARKVFISLIDDDYLKSELSDSFYIAPHKKTVESKKTTGT